MSFLIAIWFEAVLVANGLLLFASIKRHSDWPIGLACAIVFASALMIAHLTGW
jgi:hypothetical protein